MFETELNYYFIIELCHGENLTQKLKKPNKFPEVEIVSIIKGILTGINYMHSQKIMHRDLKPDNILFKEKLEIETPDNLRIIDFGLSSSTTDNTKYDNLFLRCGTPGYISPEIMKAKNKKDYGEKVDIFSIGVILHQM